MAINVWFMLKQTWYMKEDLGIREVELKEENSRVCAQES